MRQPGVACIGRLIFRGALPSMGGFVFILITQAVPSAHFLDRRRLRISVCALFGTFRLLLALSVVVHHIFAVSYLGIYAVHGFFVLSGYLMTLIMQQTYGYDGHGLRSFAINRALRLYPAYLVILAITVIVVTYVGSEATRTYRGIFFPLDARGWAENLTMIYLDAFPNRIQPRLSPATWALTIELFNYALIGLGVSRSKNLTWIWFLLSLLFHLGAAVAGRGAEYRYYHILSGSLPFSMGALLYHYKDKLRIQVRPALIHVAAIAWLAGLTIASIQFGQASFSRGLSATFYANIGIAAMLVTLLANQKGKPGSFDKYAGDMSYHLYLSHWIVGAFVANTLFGISRPEMSPAGAAVLACTFVICGLMSMVLIHAVERPIENMRRRVRPTATGLERRAMAAP